MEALGGFFHGYGFFQYIEPNAFYGSQSLIGKNLQLDENWNSGIDRIWMDLKDVGQEGEIINA